MSGLSAVHRESPSSHDSTTTSCDKQTWAKVALLVCALLCFAGAVLFGVFGQALFSAGELTFTVQILTGCTLGIMGLTALAFFAFLQCRAKTEIHNPGQTEGTKKTKEDSHITSALTSQFANGVPFLDCTREKVARIQTRKVADEADAKEAITIFWEDGRKHSGHATVYFKSMDNRDIFAECRQKITSVELSDDVKFGLYKLTAYQDKTPVAVWKINTANQWHLNRHEWYRADPAN